MLELRIHGRGGQGVVTLAELLAKAALKTGKQAQTLPFFGVERRGAAVKAAVRLDSAPIKVHSQSYRPDVLVLMYQNLLPLGLADGVAPKAFIIANGVEPLPVDRTQWLVDAAAIAVRNDLTFGGEPFINVPMLGAICRVLEIPQNYLEEAILEQWGAKKGAPNIAAAREAYALVKRIKGDEADA